MSPPFVKHLLFSTAVGALICVNGCSNRGQEKGQTPPAPKAGNSLSAQRPSAKIIDGDARPEIEESRAHHDALHSGDKHKEGHEHFVAEGSLVSNHGIPLLLETQAAGGFTPQRRAQMVADRLNEMVHEHSLEAEHIVMRQVGRTPTVYCYHAGQSREKGHVVATVDPKTAEQFGFRNNPQRLAYWWRDVLRDHALVIGGNPPIYTTPYTQSLQRLYAACQKERRGVPTHDGFEKALGRLSLSERDSLQSLYNSVPSHYRPQADNSPQTSARTGKRIHGETEHADAHPHE